MRLPVVVIDSDMPIRPRQSALTKPFWDGLKNQVFKVSKCNDCGALSFPPQSWCSACGGREMTWQEVSGKGKLYSLTQVHAGPPNLIENGPYAGAIIDLEDGIRLVTRWHGPADTPLDTPAGLIVMRYRDGDLFAAKPGGA